MQSASGTAVRTASLALPPGMNLAPTIAAGPGKRLFVAWQHQTPKAAVIVASARDADGAWRDPKDTKEGLSLPDVWTGNPKVKCAESGRCLMVWTQAGTPDQKFFGVAVSERATFESPWTGPADRADVLSPKIFFVDDLPRNTMGKVQKNLLRDQYKTIYGG